MTQQATATEKPVYIVHKTEQGGSGAMRISFDQMAGKLESLCRRRLEATAYYVGEKAIIGGVWHDGFNGWKWYCE